MSEGRPNPIVRAAEASHLPREMRARVGATTDPLPEGKVLDSRPELSSEIKPEVRDAERKAQQQSDEYGREDAASYEKEMHRMQNEEVKSGGKFNDDVYLGTNLKMMDSRSRGGAQNFQGSKHMDTVYRSK